SAEWGAHKALPERRSGSRSSRPLARISGQSDRSRRPGASALRGTGGCASRDPRRFGLLVARQLGYRAGASVGADPALGSLARREGNDRERSARGSRTQRGPERRGAGGEGGALITKRGASGHYHQKFSPSSREKRAGREGWGEGHSTNFASSPRPLLL